MGELQSSDTYMIARMQTGTGLSRRRHLSKRISSHPLFPHCAFLFTPASLDQNIIYFKAECDFTDKKDKAEFFYSLNGKKWNKIGAQLKMTYTLPHFMGYRFGLFNYATKEIGGIADFDFFHIDDEMSGSAEIYNKQQR